MKIKPAYILIPLIVIIVAGLGSMFTEMGMPWYENLNRPDIAPPNYIFPIAWTIIYVCTAASAMIFWSKKPHDIKFLWFSIKRKNSDAIHAVFTLFILNAVLNVLWTVLFFNIQNIKSAFVEIIVLEITTLLIMIVGYRISKLATLLLLPYLAWVGFATYLTYQFLSLNS